MTYNLREYQLNDVERIRAEYAAGADSVLHVSPTGCIAGNTIINFNRAKKGFELSIEKAYLHFNGLQKRKSYNWNRKIKTYVRSLKDNNIQLHEIENIIYSGVKEVYRIELENGFYLEATKNHKIMTSKGFVKLCNLEKSHEIMIDEKKFNGTKNKKQKPIYKSISVGRYHPYSQKHFDKRSNSCTYTIEYHRFVYEAFINKLSEKEYKEKLFSGQLKNIDFLNLKYYIIHHKDENPLNNKIENLIKLTHSEHNKIHKRYNNFGYGEPSFLKIKSIRYIGMKKTFDITCKKPYNNFVANKIIIHNSGKTVVFVYITENAYKKGKSILILTHRNNLVQQISEKLKENGLRHGIIARGYPTIKYRIQVASIQTLIRRLDRWENFDLIIADEAKHFGAKSWLKVRNKFYKSMLYGCDATPLRLDNYGLGNNFDTMVIGPSYEYLISKSFLSKPKYYVPDHINLDNVKKSMGDYNKKQLGDKFENDRYIIGNAIEYYAKYADRKPGMIFCINIKETIKTAEQFRKAGYAAVAIHSKMDYKEVRQAILDLRDGKIHVITSCDMVGEGTDIPRVECIIQLRPTLSLAINHQQHGRGCRPYPDKEYSIHIDQVGNCERFGLIHWPIEWKLTKEKFIPKIAGVKICKYCFAAYSANLKTCPECGYMHLGKKKRSPLEQRDGKLKEVNYRELNEKIEKAGNLQELHKIAKNVGYKPGWAYIQWKHKLNRKETA